MATDTTDNMPVLPTRKPHKEECAMTPASFSTTRPSASALSKLATCVASRKIVPDQSPIREKSCISIGFEHKTRGEPDMALDTRQHRLLEIACGSSPPLSPKYTMEASPETSSFELSSTDGSILLESLQSSQISPPANVPRSVPSKHASISPKIAPDPMNDFELPDNDCGQCYNIKTTLTDLLNCDTVRNDPKIRLLIQSRLMELERELKRQRRCRQRQSSLPTKPTIVISPADDEHRHQNFS